MNWMDNLRARSPYSVTAFRWTEKEYTLRYMMEEFSRYLPFLIIVTQGYSSCRAEITADEIYWIREVALQTCLVVKDDKGHYYSIPECLQQKVIPLQQTELGTFLRMMPEIPVSEFRECTNCRHFRFSSSIEVFEGASDSKMCKFNVLEVVDTYEEKLFAGYPLLMEPGRNDTMAEIQRKNLPMNSGALYPQVTLIPVWLPIIVSVALCGNKRSDHKFLKTMLELRHLSQFCVHDYKQILKADAEIMVFEKPPVDKIYDYIRLEPLLKDRGRPTNLAPVLPDDENPYGYEDGRALYEQVNPYDSEEEIMVVGTERDEPTVALCLKHRVEPIVLQVDMPLLKRLAYIQTVYDSGILPVDDDPPTPPLPPKPKPVVLPKPKLPSRTGTVSYDQPLPGTPPEEPPPPVPDRCPIGEPPGYKILRSGSVPSGITSKSSTLNSNEKAPGKSSSHTNDMFSKIKKNLEKLTQSKAKKHAIVEHDREDPDGQGDMGNAHEKLREVHFKNLQDIPADVSELSVSQLSECLHLLNLQEYSAVMERALVDGELLKTLTETILIDQFGFTDFNATKLVRFAAGWRPKV